MKTSHQNPYFHAHRCGLSRPAASLFSVVLAAGFIGAGGQASGQQNVFHRNNSSPIWWDDVANPWFYQTSDNSQNRPDNGGRNDVFIGHNSNTTMAVNGAFFQLRTLTIQSSATSNRIFNASDGGGISLSEGFTNASTGSQTFNVPIVVDGASVVFQVSESAATTTFTNDFFLNANMATFTGPGSISVSGTLTGTGGGITKTGSGTLTLTGTNNYTGATSVNQGTLVVGVGGSGSLGGTTVTVASGATLMGSGMLNGSVVIEGGGIHAPGNGIGAQGVNNLSYDDNSIFAWEMDFAAGNEGARGTNYDAINLSGNLTGPGDAVFRIVLPGSADFGNAFWNVNRTWTDIFMNGSAAIANWADQFSSTLGYFNAGGSISAPNALTQGSFTLSGNTLSWTAIPEPSTALAGLLMVAGLLRRRR